ncbi:MAG: efflux RND transporter periplasmic adaptor subunit [Candidatus Thiodiazotropha sp.]
MSVQPQAHQARLRGSGEARARYELTLTADVSGRVVSIAPELETGQRVGAKSELAKIDSVAYLQGVASARQMLAEAQVALQQELHESERALAEWKQAGLDNSEATPLLLRKPQMKAARARAEQARAQLQQAEQDLAHTQVQAPFDAIVTERHVSPGQYVRVGDPLATLYSIDSIEVRIGLSQQQWLLFPPVETLLGTRVTLSGAQGQRWLGKIIRVDQHIDRNSRQRSLVVSVQDPLQQTIPLIPGTFLKAEFAGGKVDDILAVPASSLMSNGRILHVDASNRLAVLQVSVIFQQDGTLYVRSTDPSVSLKSLRVLTAPLPSYVAGLAVISKAPEEIVSR